MQCLLDFYGSSHMVCSCLFFVVRLPGRIVPLSLMPHTSGNFLRDFFSLDQYDHFCRLLRPILQRMELASAHNADVP